MLKSIASGLSAPTQSSAGIAANASAPAASYVIGQEFKRRNAEGSLGHLLAHATLGGLTAAAGGNDPLAGALSSGGAEAAAGYISGLFGQTDGSRLSAEQKETVTAITGLIGTAAGAALGSTPADVAQGSLNARNSVENNFLLPRDTRHISAESARLVQKVAQLAAAKLSPEEMKYLYIETFVDEIRAINRSNRSEQEKQRAYHALLQKHERVSKVVENVFKTIPIGHKDRHVFRMELVRDMNGLLFSDYEGLAGGRAHPNLLDQERTDWLPDLPSAWVPGKSGVQRVHCTWTGDTECLSVADVHWGRIASGGTRPGISRPPTGTKPTAAAHTPPAAAPVPRPPAGQENRRTSLASPSAAGQGKSGHTAPATPTQPNRQAQTGVAPNGNTMNAGLPNSKVIPGNGSKPMTPSRALPNPTAEHGGGSRPSTRERVHRNNQETERGNRRSQFRQHAQTERKVRTGAESGTMSSGGDTARKNVPVPRPQHLAHPDNAIGRNKQPSAGGQRTSGGNPAIDRDPYSPSSVDSRVNNLENRREVGAPYSNHSEKVSTRHDSSLPTKHEPNSSMDLNDNEGTKQRRYFDKDGRAVEDIDYRHSNGDNSHVFPHRHSWDWSSGKADRSRHEKKIKE